MNDLTRTLDPALEPVTVDDAMSFLRAYPQDRDRVAGLIKVAREFVENYTSRALITQTWRKTMSAWPAGEQYRVIPLERTPVDSVNYIKYFPAGFGPSSIIQESEYNVVIRENETGFIELNEDASWPAVASRSNAIEIEFTAGVSDPEKVPAVLAQAVRLIVANFYEQRAPLNIGNIVNELPYNLKHLLDSQKVGGWVA